MPISIYLIEDDASVRDFVLRALQQRPGWTLAGYSPSLGHALAHSPGDQQLQGILRKQRTFRLPAFALEREVTFPPG